MPIPDDLKKSLAKPLGRIPSGVYILTATHDGVSQAMLASWIQQAGFDPPCVSIAIAQDRPIAPLIQASQRLAISILPADDTALMKKYARGIPPGADPFAGVETQLTPAGLPILCAAHAWLECQLLQHCAYGSDHDLLLAQVTSAAMLKDCQPFTHVRNNGFHY